MRFNDLIAAFARSVVFLATMIPAFGADAQSTFVGPEEKPYELWKIDAGGGKPQRFAETPGYTCGAPEWSPDGTLIAYDTWPVGRTFSDSSIAVVNADGTGSKIIGNGGMPSWSPDGKQLACHTYDNPQTIVVMNADGSGREVIIDHWGSPRWFPRSNRIASLDTNRRLLLFDLTDGKERPFPLAADRGPMRNRHTAEIGFGISPDGQQICFGDSDSGLFLATLNKRGETTIRQLTEDLHIRFCSWSPDGKQVVFCGSSKQQDIIDFEEGSVKNEIYRREQLFVIDVDSTDPPKLLPGQDELRVNSCPDWSPDGNTIVYVSQVSRDEFEAQRREMLERENGNRRLREAGKEIRRLDAL